MSFLCKGGPTMESEVFSPEEICLMRLVVTFRRAFSSGNESPPRQVIHESRKKCSRTDLQKKDLLTLQGSLSERMEKGDSMNLSQICRGGSYITHPPLRSHRLVVRTPGSHPGNTGSTPVGTAYFKIL